VSLDQTRELPVKASPDWQSGGRILQNQRGQLIALLPNTLNLRLQFAIPPGELSKTLLEFGYGRCIGHAVPSLRARV